MSLKKILFFLKLNSGEIPTPEKEQLDKVNFQKYININILGSFYFLLIPLYDYPSYNGRNLVLTNLNISVNFPR